MKLLTSASILPVTVYMTAVYFSQLKCCYGNRIFKSKFQFYKSHIHLCVPIVTETHFYNVG